MGSLALNLRNSALLNKTMMLENMNGCDTTCDSKVTKDSACSLSSLTSPTDSEPSSIFSEDYLQMTDDQACESDDDADSQGEVSKCSSFYDLERELQKLTFKCNPEQVNTNGDIFQLSGHSDALAVFECKLNSAAVTENLSCTKQQTDPVEKTENEVESIPRTASEPEEFEYLQRRAVLRSASVKSCKTPPGSPGRKKVVRFADTLGLDLEDVRHFINDPTTIPDSALNDLEIGSEVGLQATPTLYLQARFAQPGTNLHFLTRVLDANVVLENCMINDVYLTVTGVIRVTNIAFHKKVMVRFSTNEWSSSADVTASYVPKSHDGQTDQFAFSISVPSSFHEGNKLEFAVMLAANGQEFWDSNYGRNYVIECFTKNLMLERKRNNRFKLPDYSFSGFSCRRNYTFSY